MKNIPLGEVLKEYGFITEEQLQEALSYQKQDRSKRLGTVLIEKGFVTERQVLEALGQKLHYNVIRLKDYKVDTESVAKLPKPIAQKYNVIAIGTNGGRLAVAMSDPLNFYAQEDIRQITGEPLEIVLAETDEVKNAIDYYYSEVSAKIAAKAANLTAQAPVAESIGEFDATDGDDDAPVVKLINSLLLNGCSSNASDIHIEPFETKTTVRMRMDGVIMDFVTLAASLHPALIARIKIMSGMDIAEKRIPQDGHFKTTIEKTTMNVRVSVIPTVFGEKAVLRFLSTDNVIDRSGKYGMSDENYAKLTKMLASPNGIIYITGPTGSGKTTTLYMVLDTLAQRQVNISTIEDPVERNLAKINQMQVNNQAGLTFGIGLRALLRQDPDVIMIGETRDAETAQISVRAAITGHLVLSTLHTNDAVSSIVRLGDMDVPNYLVASSLVGVVAQRLVRKVCANCGYDDEPTEAEKAIIGNDVTTVRRGKGCHVCNGTGYKGRISIHEIILIDKTIRKMISSNASTEDIFDYAREHQGMKTLRDSAVELVRSGITTVDELLKVTYYSD